jgi:hypothetical protein
VATAATTVAEAQKGKVSMNKFASMMKVFKIYFRTAE